MDEIEALHDTEAEANKSVDYDLHIPKDFHVMVVVNNFVFGNINQIKKDHRVTLSNHQHRTVYLPSLDLGQLYIPTTGSKPVVLGRRHNLTLQVFPLSYHSYLMFYTFGHF